MRPGWATPARGGAFSFFYISFFFVESIYLYIIIELYIR